MPEVAAAAHRISDPLSDHMAVRSREPVRRMPDASSIEAIAQHQDANIQFLRRGFGWMNGSRAR